MTQFLTIEKETATKENPTIFTHFYKHNKGWIETRLTPENFDKVIFLGTCEMDGDMFSAYICGFIEIFKGIKGNEFNN
jgi:hypothetical protein